jgi:hypothetical protein
VHDVTDIYGAPLKPGYCKFHPVVAVPYPCPLCQVKLHEEHVVFEPQPDTEDFIVRRDPMWLVYVNKSGEQYYRAWAEVDAGGTLVDPETGDDLELIGWTLVE